MKAVEIFQRKGREGMRDEDGGANLTKIYFKHICKYHNVALCTIIMLIKS
jgi:hypothetical protein